MHTGSTDPRPESQAQRDDRNVAELLQELRVAGLGVQVLFGFLLGLPFTARFSKLSQAQRALYVADVLLAAVATVLLVGPVAYHRLVFRQQQKEHLIRAANVMAIGGLITVALAISTAVLLILSYVVPGAPAIATSACLLLAFAVLWVAVPVTRRRRAQRTEDDRPRGQSDGCAGRHGVAVHSRNRRRPAS